MSGQGESAQDVAARDDAHLRSLGIKPELKRTLGFLSNFAVAFSYHQRVDRHVHELGSRLRRRRAGDLLDLAAW